MLQSHNNKTILILCKPHKFQKFDFLLMIQQLLSKPLDPHFCPKNYLGPFFTLGHFSCKSNSKGGEERGAITAGRLCYGDSLTYICYCMLFFYFLYFFNNEHGSCINNVSSCRVASFKIDQYNESGLVHENQPIQVT